ncbi:YdcF family protein [Pantanalinema rosaneae CENA516]|uniref:YdcF family protein n=1 Tax=Pantanalinema rosaneae TaxID=1620701 RepID=UPI003D6EB9E3
MFLFLSKLLPLFLYPLGLACVLMVVALGMLLWKLPRRLAAIPILLALTVLLVSSNGWVSNGIVRSLEFQHLPSGELPKADAIVVLGGATKPASPPRPWVDLSEEGDRVIYGAKLYREGKAPRLILAGGRIDWWGDQPSESADMAAIVELMGVPKSAILQEPDSLTTYENAVNVKKILDAQGIRQILLVTSAMHMPRSLLIFQKQGIDAIPAPVDFLTTDRDLQAMQSSPQSVLLTLMPEADRLKETTRALKEYLGTVIYRLRGWL